MGVLDIEAIEELVDKIGECYGYPAQEDVDALNQLTGLNWDAKTYWEYCCEYWSHDSLETTVWALLHDGEYPEQNEVRVVFWKTDYCFQESNEEIWMKFRLGKSRKISNRFADLPIKEIYKWFVETFPEWEGTEDDIEKEYESIAFHPEKNAVYGLEQEILFFPYHKKCLSITFSNIEKEDMERIITYVKRYVNVVYIAED